MACDRRRGRTVSVGQLCRERLHRPARCGRAERWQLSVGRWLLAGHRRRALHAHEHAFPYTDRYPDADIHTDGHSHSYAHWHPTADSDTNCYTHSHELPTPTATMTATSTATTTVTPTTPVQRVYLPIVLKNQL